MASLDGTIDASDVLVLQEKVGAVQPATANIICASATLKVTASSGKQQLSHS